MAKPFSVTIKSTLSDGTPIVNVMHQLADFDGGDFYTPSAHVVADDFTSSIMTKYRAMLPTNATVHWMIVKEMLATGDTTIPDYWEKSIELAGTRTPPSPTLQPSVATLLKLGTGAPVRGARGRMWLPPSLSAGDTISGGKWDLTTVYGTACTNFATEYNTIHHYGTTPNHYQLIPIVYSKRRRDRGDSNYWFQIQTASVDPLQHWLDSRASFS